MSKILINNGYFSREPDLNSAADQALVNQAIANGQSVVHVQLDDETCEIMDRYTQEMRIGSYICSRPNAFERDTFLEYVNLHSTLFVLNQWGFVGNMQVLPKQLWGMLEELEQRRAKLVQVAPPEEGLWYIWGNDMPNQKLSQTADWRYCYDASDYKPFLIPYLLPDQSKAKGNIIIISGGAYEWRSNRWEGYEAVGRFNSLGYNAFLLQRRVYPYSKLDGAQDLQRAIRFLKANAEKFGICAIENLCVNGYSGGGMCILDMLSECYSTSDPSAVYSDYSPDETDRLSSDVSAALIIYGSEPARLQNIEKLKSNPKLPAVFMVSGQEDFASMDVGSSMLYQAIRNLVPTELHIYASVPHGFGVGSCEDVSNPADPKKVRIVTAAKWPEAADLFLQTQWGLLPNMQPQ